MSRSRPVTPTEGGRGRPPTMPSYADSAISPRGMSMSMTSLRSTTPSSAGATQRARRAHELETRLWQADQKLVDAQCKLTTANLELSRLRSSAEQHAQEVSYVRRLLEREQRERSSLEAEASALRHSLKSATRNAGPSSSVESERVLLLKAQLEEAQERGRALSTEVERRREEVEQLKGAIAQRGEPAELRSELSVVRDERVRLALELHEAKQTATAAKAEAAHANHQMVAIDSLRASYAAETSELGRSRVEVSQLQDERSRLLEEHATLLNQAQGMARELESVRAAHGQVSE